MFTGKRVPAIALGALLAAAGLGAGLASAYSGTSGPPVQASATGTAGPAAGQDSGQPAPAWMTSYGGYAAMMGRYGGAYGMMGGSGPSGGMMGGTGGGPNGTVYSGTDMSRIMGGVPAAAPGLRISAAQAQAEAAAVPAGARVDTAANTVAFAGRAVTLTAVAGPDGRSMYTFEVAGLTDPAISIPAGAQITLRFVDADTDMAHGIVVTAADPATAAAWMPMMNAAPAFPGAAIWALGESGSTGAPTATTSFTAATPGTYTYLCPVPGHAQQGMYGTLTVN
jgi:rusticyanin